MAPLFFTGIVLLIVAFVSAAAEGAVRATFNMKGYFVSTQDLWSALSPKTLIFARHAVEDFYPVLWDPIVLALFSFPAWIVAGVPGMALVIYCRPASKRSGEPIDEESLYLIDNLVVNARLEGYDDEEGDIGSSFEENEVYEESDDPESDIAHEKRRPEAYMEEWDPNDSFPENIDPENPLNELTEKIDLDRSTLLDKK
jgi:hypothetical protein